MVSILIAEDEKTTRDGLVKHINWDKVGIDAIHTVANGLEAIEFTNKIKPDILITDVRMPKLNGIELSKYFKENLPECKIIFLSAYADKDYLKNAITVGAVEYIEKPIDILQIETILTDAVKLCEEQKLIQDNSLKLLDLTKQNKIITQRQSVQHILYKTDTDIEALLNNLVPNFNINSHHTVFVAYLKCDFPNSLTQEKQYHIQKKIDTFLIDLTNILKLNMQIDVFSAFWDLNVLPLIFISNKKISYQQTFSLCTDFINYLHKDNQDINYTLALGTLINSIHEIQTSKINAIACLDKLFYYNENCVIINDYVFYDGDKLLSDDFYESFKQGLKNNSFTNIETALNELLDNILLNPNYRVDYIKNIYFNLINLVFEFSKSQQISLGDFDESYIWQDLTLFENIHQMHRYLFSLIEQFIDQSKIQINIGSTIYEITKYINEELSDSSLCIKSIAEHFHYNHFYLCTYFKKCTSKTILDYITEMRIDKAKYLLLDHTLKLYDITQMIGYNDPAYFSRTFKKYTGVTPSAYREKGLHEK